MDVQELLSYTDEATSHLLCHVMHVGVAGTWLATVAHDVIVAAAPALTESAAEFGYQFKRGYWYLCLEKGIRPHDASPEQWEKVKKTLQAAA